MQHKIPAFLSKEFASLKTKEGKEEFLQGYNRWKSNTYTELLTIHLEKEFKETYASEDSKFDFLSWFQRKEFSSFYKGTRTILRKVIKQIGN